MDSYITVELFRFFRELAENNNRDWFQAHKARYEKDVRVPLLEFVRAFRVRLHSISPHFRADDRRVGGSLFRIHRDTRFAHDKTPYKIHAGLQFRHEQGKDAHTAGFYLHLQPGESFLAMGLWRPDGPSLLKIRRKIAEQPDLWRRVVSQPAFASNFEFGGESLQRVPKGFSSDHPLADVLKRKDFVVSRDLTEAEILRSGFIDAFAQQCAQGRDFMAFLTAALDLPF